MKLNIPQLVYAGWALLYVGAAGVCLAFGHHTIAGVFLIGVASCMLGLYVKRDRGDS